MTFLRLYEDISFTTHYCCSSCHSPFDSRDSDCSNGCDKGSVEFLTVAVEAQLRRKLQGTYISIQINVTYANMPTTLSDPTFWNHLKERECVSDDSLKDVCGGWEYLRHKHFVRKPGNVTFLLNTDGVSLFRSSSTSLWPIWLAVNELPPHVRCVSCCRMEYNYIVLFL